MSWRQADRGEDDQVVAFCLALYREAPTPALAVTADHACRTLLRLRQTPAKGRTLVLEIDGRLQGYAFLISYWSNEYGGELCCIDELYVRPEVRGEGHATLLIEALARGEGLLCAETVGLALEVMPGNARALALYDRLGVRGGNRALRRLIRGD